MGENATSGKQDMRDGNGTPHGARPGSADDAALDASEPTAGAGAPDGGTDGATRSARARAELRQQRREAVNEHLASSAGYDYDPRRNKAMRDAGDIDPGRKTIRLGKRTFEASDVVKLVGLLAFLVILGVACAAVWPTVHGMFEEGGASLIIQSMQEAGPLGVFLLLGLQLVQIIVAFIPGEVVQVVAGALYGPIGGTAIILVGAIIASAAVFQLVHLLGAPFIRAMVSDDFLEKFRNFEKTGRLNVIVFILFLIPGLPKDVFTYLVGVTDMRLPTFLLLSTLGRAPGVFVSSYAASSIMKGDYLVSAIMFGVLALVAIIAIVFRDKILDALSRHRGA